MLLFPKKRGKKRRLAYEEEEEEDFADDVESDSAQGSPTYVESGDSSSDDGGDNGEFSVLIVFSTFFVLSFQQHYIYIYMHLDNVFSYTLYICISS